MAPALADLDQDLRAMWKAAAAAREGGGGIYRAALSNLVTPLDAEGHRRYASTLVEVTRRHPSRLIVVEIGHEEEPGGLQGEVAALCHVRQAGGYVCSEQIVLRGGASAGPLVPSAVRSLLVGNLPLTLLDLREGPTPGWVEEICERADLRLCDSGNLPPGAERHAFWARVAGDAEGRVRDLAWVCLAPWREVVADAFDTARLTPALREVREVAIEIGSDVPCSPGPPLFAAWIASRLGWMSPEGRGGETRFRASGTPAVIRVKSRPGSPGRDPVRIRFLAEDPRRLDLTVRHDPGTAVATVDVTAPAVSRYEIPFAERDLASMIVTEMHRHRPNPVLCDAARIAPVISLPDDGSAH
jgi:hypothetical protein